MKCCFDKRVVVRNFTPGERVLVLLPSPAGPYVIKSKLSDTDYIVHTPE